MKIKIFLILLLIAVVVMGCSKNMKETLNIEGNPTYVAVLSKEDLIISEKEQFHIDYIAYYPDGGLMIKGMYFDATEQQFSDNEGHFGDVELNIIGVDIIPKVHPWKQRWNRNFDGGKIISSTQLNVDIPEGYQALRIKLNFITHDHQIETMLIPYKR